MCVCVDWQELIYPVMCIWVDKNKNVSWSITEKQNIMVKRNVYSWDENRTQKNESDNRNSQVNLTFRYLEKKLENKTKMDRFFIFRYKMSELNIKFPVINILWSSLLFFLFFIFFILFKRIFLSKLSVAFFLIFFSWIIWNHFRKFFLIWKRLWWPERN